MGCECVPSNRRKLPHNKSFLRAFCKKIKERDKREERQNACDFVSLYFFSNYSFTSLFSRNRSHLSIS